MLSIISQFEVDALHNLPQSPPCAKPLWNATVDSVDTDVIVFELTLAKRYKYTHTYIFRRIRSPHLQIFHPSGQIFWCKDSFQHFPSPPKPQVTTLQAPLPSHTNMGTSASTSDLTRIGISAAVRSCVRCSRERVLSPYGHMNPRAKRGAALIPVYWSLN